MIPSKTWFPQGIQERAAWFLNFYTQLVKIADALNVSADKVKVVQDDNSVMQFLADADVQVKAYDKAARQYRKIITEGNIGDNTPEFPAAPALALPIVVTTGIFERLDKLVKQIRDADAYTAETGALLGILPVQQVKIPLAELKPTITAAPLPSGYKFTVETSKLGASAFKVQIRRMDSELWTDIGFGTKSPIEATLPNPTAPGQVERIQARVILMENNQPVGTPSDPAYVNVNP
jgi:hypothetical protein